MTRAFAFAPFHAIFPFILLFVLFRCNEVLAVSSASKVSRQQQHQDLVARGGTAQQALSAHNAARAKHGASPLVWDPKLASYAASKASQCHFEHTGGPYGENLAAGTSMTYSSAVKMWMAESSAYHPGDGFSTSSGHFTQVVWKGSKRLGCALITTCSSSQLGFGRRSLDGSKVNTTTAHKGATGIILRDEEESIDEEDVPEGADRRMIVVRKKKGKHAHAHHHKSNHKKHSHKKHSHKKHSHKNHGKHTGTHQHPQQHAQKGHTAKQHHRKHTALNIWPGFGGYFYPPSHPTPPSGNNGGEYGGSEPYPGEGSTGGSSGGSTGGGYGGSGGSGGGYGGSGGGGGGGMGYVMCEYDPPGNIMGEFDTNVEL
ncbi:hypothetical protein CF319_g6766 [Tilletia indica]|uniref:SCP domain-containing protein n=1 Tax=Tilletia walkeri TaxID=117179 RepID=A0A8X7N6Z7_9BASI|nr:hypothetical protein CF319_g6766 [Tilletia indica]KAE8230969.1 hypothetical protein CF326_g4022 [Tilletia indica]KAE8266796.1 hypothetical protein A4X09_0g5555 [Tilletia walkeri]